MQQTGLRGQDPGFEPIYNEKSRVLILGTYPSPKSFETGFYYGHPQNRFWPLISTLCGTPCPKTKVDKIALLQDKNIALWDVLESCDIKGAADSSIKNPKPNPIHLILQSSPIEAVFCNGSAAHTLYKRYCKAMLSVPVVRVPSTSAANAACNLVCLLQQWAVVLPYLS